MKLLDPQLCPHETFETHSKVGRLTDGDNGPVTGFTFDCKVKCTQCDTFFEWVGVPAGMSPEVPMANVDFMELRAPIRPNTGAFATSLSYKVKPDVVKPENIN